MSDLSKIPYPIAYLVTIYDGPRPLIVMDHTRDLDAVTEAVDQINRHKKNQLRVYVESDILMLIYHGHVLLRGTLPHPIDNSERDHICRRLHNNMRDLRATVAVSAASDNALEKAGIK